MTIPLLIPLERPYREATIPAQSSATLYEYNVPSARIVFIQGMAWTIHEGNYWRVLIDNLVYEQPKIERKLGTISRPAPINPPIHAKQNIKLTYYNESSLPVRVECLVNALEGDTKKEVLKQLQ